MPIIKEQTDLIDLIKDTKNKKKLTDEKIAHYAGLSKSTISDLFSGKSKEFTFLTILKIIEALDCELEISLKEIENN